MTAPWATCWRCGADLYPRLARRTDDGWVHATCCDCDGRISAQSKSGRCRSCNMTALAVAKRNPIESERNGGPCRRCSLPTTRRDGLCRDCRDVVDDLGETGRWAA